MEDGRQQIKTSITEQQGRKGKKKQSQLRRHRGGPEWTNQVLRRGEPFRDEVFGTSDEILESVLLLQELSVFVPQTSLGAQESAGETGKREIKTTVTGRKPRGDPSITDHLSTTTDVPHDIGHSSVQQRKNPHVEIRVERNSITPCSPRCRIPRRRNEQHEKKKEKGRRKM